MAEDTLTAKTQPAGALTAGTLTAGTARIDITPPLGFRMQGAMRRIEGAMEVEQPLTATALALADDRHKIIILDCDLIGFDLPLAQTIRRQIADRVGTTTTHVTLGCTHTHNGPCTARGVLGGPHHVAPRAGEIEALDHYVEVLTQQLAGVSAMADGARRPARAGAGRGHAAVAVNREEVAADGRVLVGRNPDGATDHAVDVLRVDDPAGNPIAAIVGYAAHPVVMGYQIYDLSPDFPGVVRRIVEGATGATCLYLTGAAGNQACWSFLQGDWGEKERTGGQVAGAALQAFYGIETRPHREVREEGRSISAVALYRKEFEDGPTHRVLRSAERTGTVALQPLPSLAAAERQAAAAEETLRRLREQGASTELTAPQEIEVYWTRTVLDRVRSGDTRCTIDYDLIGHRLDDFVLLGMQGEPFVEIGLGAKRRSKAAHTMFAGYVNGVLGYVPTAQTVRQGGMSVSSAVRTYDLPAPPAEDAVDTLVAGFGELLADLGL